MIIERPEAGNDADLQGAAGVILVVDDQELNRQLLVEMLEPRGYRLLEAANGEDALRMVREENPDLVLLDITMPTMDGLEVCRRIRRDPESEALPIIMVTALAHRQQQLDGIAAGASDYLTKPVDSANLLLRVRNAMHFRQLHNRLASQYATLQELERTRDALVHMIVHDLRSPLQAIGMRLEFARDRAKELAEHEMLDDIESVFSSARVMREMVSDVIESSRLEAGLMPVEKIEFDMIAIAREAIDLVASPGSARVTSKAPVAPCFGDAAVVRRVLSNLVANACRVSENGTPVDVVVSSAPAGTLVEVIDAGPGIAPQDSQRIFEKFWQVEGTASSRRTSGLGLYFCKLAMDAHGGSIGVDSEPGKGARFWLELPAAGMHILVVDDEPRMLDSMRRVLGQRHGWTATLARGGHEAMKLMATSRFDVIVTDLGMSGMDGSELLQFVAATYPETTRIVLSGHGASPLADQARLLSHAVLAKPIDRDTLITTIDTTHRAARQSRTVSSH